MEERDAARHRRRLERMYEGAAITRTIPMRLRVEDGRARVRFEVEPRFLHAAGGLHGSLYFRAMDDAAFFAVASRVRDAFVLTATFTVDLLRPVAAGEVRAEGRAVERRDAEGRFVAVARLRDAEGNVLGRGRGAFARSRIPLETLSGYAG